MSQFQSLVKICCILISHVVGMEEEPIPTCVDNPFFSSHRPHHNLLKLKVETLIFIRHK